MTPGIKALGARITAAGLRFEPRGPVLNAARTLLALGQFVSLALTPDWVLFAGGGVGPTAPNGSGLRALTLWGAASGAGALSLRRVLALVVLLAVISGYRPRWTCVPHWYVTFSLTTTSAVADDGDSAARILTLLLVPMLLGDLRRWQWSNPATPLDPVWRGRTWAGWLLIRVQVAIIYGQAALSKVADPVWRHGTAMYYWLHGHYWGGPPAWHGWLFPALEHGWFVKPLTWSAVAAELGIAVAVLGPRPARRGAVVVAVALHGSIAVLMGLPTFGATMIAMVLVTLADTRFVGNIAKVPRCCLHHVCGSEC